MTCFCCSGRTTPHSVATMCSVYGVKTMFPLVPLVPRAVPPVLVFGMFAGLTNGVDKDMIGNVSTGETPAGNQRSGTVKAAADGVPGQGDKRIKLAVSLLDGPQVVAEALPESGSSLLGHEASLRYFRGERYLEVDVDLASSSASSRVTSLCREHAKSLSLEVGLILHGESESELPESVLGVLRIDKLDPQDTTRHRLLWGS
ncbi:unnamed protein product [Ectocarpus sp. 12 AP-2014]